MMTIREKLNYLQKLDLQWYKSNPYNYVVIVNKNGYDFGYFDGEGKLTISAITETEDKLHEVLNSQIRNFEKRLK